MKAFKCSKVTSKVHHAPKHCPSMGLILDTRSSFVTLRECRSCTGLFPQALQREISSVNVLKGSGKPSRIAVQKLA